MTKDVHDILMLKHSRLLRNARTWGLECGDGWFKIIAEMLDKIEELDKYKKLYITQIKEKFATLRVYTAFEMDQTESDEILEEYNKIDNEVQAIINDAEKKSLITCELCGNRGKLSRPRGFWLRTMCAKCRKKDPSTKLVKSNKID